MICEIITRSEPLIMKVPESVIKGISPMKTSASLISPVSLKRKRKVTLSLLE